MASGASEMGTSWWDNLGLSIAREWKSMLQFAERYGFILLGLAVLAVLGHLFAGDGSRWWKTRRRVQKVQRGEAQASDATLLYQRMLKVLRRRGIEKPAWLTPCEFARVVQEPELSVLVEDLTDAYNQLRFGGDAQAARQMMTLLKRLETLA